jgi:C4-dicarboxylate-specific signal transduction histidine kinase
VGATDSATIRAINSERAELSARVYEVRRWRAAQRQYASSACHLGAGRSDTKRHVADAAPARAQANAAVAHEPYVMGTDPELDSFLVRTLLNSASALQALSRCASAATFLLSAPLAALRSRLQPACVHAMRCAARSAWLSDVLLTPLASAACSTRM